MSEESEFETIRSDPDPASDQQHTAVASVAVVGIGASAGGLEVCRHLLADLSGDTGPAIVVIQHLDPTHESSLAEILARITPMPVTEASGGVPVEPNHV